MEEKLPTNVVEKHKVGVRFLDNGQQGHNFFIAVEMQKDVILTDALQDQLVHWLQKGLDHLAHLEACYDPITGQHNMQFIHNVMEERLVFCVHLENTGSHFDTDTNLYVFRLVPLTLSAGVVRNALELVPLPTGIHAVAVSALPNTLMNQVWNDLMATDAKGGGYMEHRMYKRFPETWNTVCEQSCLFTDWKPPADH